MHQEPGTLNGASTLYLLVGEIRSDVKHLRIEVDGVKRSLASIERQPRKIPWGDLVPYVSGLVALGLAVAGKWEALASFLQSSGH